MDLNTCPERPMFMHSPIGLHIHKPIRTNPHVHVEAIFTAYHEYPTVFSSAGLHSLRSKDLTFPSGFTCTLNSQLICLSTYPHTYLPENKSTCSSWCFPSADHEDLPVNSTIHLHQYMPTDTLIHQPTCSFWSFHSNQPVISTCPSTDPPPPPPVHYPTCSRLTYMLTCQPICWSKYPQTYLMCVCMCVCVYVCKLHKLLVYYVTFVFSITVLWVLKYEICVIVYCDVVNVQPRFNFSDEIIT